MYPYSYPPIIISTTSQQRRVHSHHYSPPDDELQYYNLRQAHDSNSRYIYESERLTRVLVSERTPEMRRRELQHLFERVDAQEWFKKEQQRRLEDVTNVPRRPRSRIGGALRAPLGLFPIREREEVDVDPVKKDPKMYHLEEETRLMLKNALEGRIYGDKELKVERENELDEEIVFVPRNDSRNEVTVEEIEDKEEETLKPKCTMA